MSKKHRPDECTDAQCAKCAAIDPHMTENGEAGVMKMTRIEAPPVPSDIQKRIDKIHAAKRVRDAAPDLLAALQEIKRTVYAGMPKGHAKKVQDLCEAAILRATEAR